MKRNMWWFILVLFLVISWALFAVVWHYRQQQCEGIGAKAKYTGQGMSICVTPDGRVVEP